MLNYDQGEYEVQILSQAIGKSKGGTPYLYLQIQPVKFFALDGEQDMSHGPTANLYMYITSKTVEYRLRDLESMGYTGSSFSQLDPSADGFHDLKGVRFRAKCVHEDYNDKTHEKWDVSFNSTPQVDALTQTEVSQLDKLFASKRKAKPAAATKAAKPVHVLEPVTSEAEDDSIPF
jgi:hypothetical protein